MGNSHGRIWRSLIIFTTILLAIIAIPRLYIEFNRLLNPSYGHQGAIDLLLRHMEIHRWRAGEQIYITIGSAVYPPASYTILSPFLWSPSPLITRLLWGVSTIIILSVIVSTLVNSSLSQSKWEQALIILLIVSSYGTSITIGNGQLSILVIGAILISILLIKRYPGNLKIEIFSCVLASIALVKPTVALPFLWIIVLSFMRLRPMVLIVSIYVILGLIGCWYVNENYLLSHILWMSKATVAAGSSGAAGRIAITQDMGYNDIHSLFSILGWKNWNTLGTLMVLLTLGIWLYRNRQVDLWIQLGVTAIISRVWTHHRVYDDMVVLLAIFALFRICKQYQMANCPNFIAESLLMLSIYTAVSPVSLRLKMFPVGFLYKSLLFTEWMGMLIFLLYQASRQKQNLTLGIECQQYTTQN